MKIKLYLVYDVMVCVIATSTDATVFAAPPWQHPRLS